MNRREFVKGTFLATGIGALGQFSAFPALAKEDGLDTHGRPAALEPIRGYVKNFKPVTEGPTDSAHYMLKYDIIHWRGGRRDAARNGVVGTLEIRRQARRNDVRYTIKQNVEFGGRQNILHADIACAPDPPNTLRNWDLHTFARDRNGKKMPLSELREEGQNRDGRIEVSGSNYDYKRKARRPVVTQWTFLHGFLDDMGQGGIQRFDVLHDLSLFKPDQQLRHGGEITSKVGGGQTMRFDTYAQLGEGTLPIHYVVDDAGRPQFVTTAMLSWALADVS